MNQIKYLTRNYYSLINSSLTKNSTMGEIKSAYHKTLIENNYQVGSVNGIDKQKLFKYICAKKAYELLLDHKTLLFTNMNKVINWSKKNIIFVFTDGEICDEETEIEKFIKNFNQNQNEFYAITVDESEYFQSIIKRLKNNPVTEVVNLNNINQVTRTFDKVNQLLIS